MPSEILEKSVTESDFSLFLTHFYHFKSRYSQVGGNPAMRSRRDLPGKRQALRRHSRAGGNLEMKNHGVIGND
ncbi:hypothetical protein [Neisseria viridiae]|uniref:hypothetical protein n=1 Tax=Neisseria viridiae TaxID=2830648 RepID=UPI002659CA84|nr:hypothetical protein [Neisseria viridiae]